LFDRLFLLKKCSRHGYLRVFDLNGYEIYGKPKLPTRDWRNTHAKESIGTERTGSRRRWYSGTAGGAYSKKNLSWGNKKQKTIICLYVLDRSTGLKFKIVIGEWPEEMRKKKQSVAERRNFSNSTWASRGRTTVFRDLGA